MPDFSLLVFFRMDGLSCPNPESRNAHLSKLMQKLGLGRQGVTPYFSNIRNNEVWKINKFGICPKYQSLYLAMLIFFDIHNNRDLEQLVRKLSPTLLTCYVPSRSKVTFLKLILTGEKSWMSRHR